ncbi:MAG: DHH family phosphoesterase [Euzebya sp.]
MPVDVRSQSVQATQVPLEEPLAKAAASLRQAGSVVVVGHINPDGDALGSTLALTVALRSLGIAAVPTWGARNAEEPPAPLEPAWAAFLPGCDLIALPDDVPSRPDVVVACDTAAASRLGTLEGLLTSAGTTIVIDHHAVGDGFGDIRIVDDSRSCTGVLVLELIDQLGVALTSAIADALYLALLTDTGRFAFQSTTAQDHRIAARLLDAGADHVAVTRAVYESAGVGYLDLVARVTQRAVVEPGLVASWVTVDDLRDTGSRENDPDGLIELLRRVEGPDVTCFLRETADGTWRSSLRSKGATDVASIAQAFGGGGHRMAAGFTGHGDAQSIIGALRRRLDTGASWPGQTTPGGGG